MAAIIEKQYITKRVAAGRRNNKIFKHTNKSAGFDSGFMSQFSQKPARKKSTLHSKNKNPELFSGFRLRLKRKEKTNFDYKKNTGTVKKSAGFSFPVPSLPALAVIAGTVVIALAALNWEDINIKIPENYIYNPQDSSVEQQTMMYAATGIAGILPFNHSITSIEPITGAITEEIPDQNGPNDLITFEWQQYRVKRGDTVSGIAQKYEVSVGAIIASNEIRNARALQEGVLLRIPNIDGIPYQIKSGDSLTKIAASFNVPLEVILDINDIKSDVIKSGETLFIPGARMNDIDLRMSLGELFTYPVRNRFITSYFGMRRDPISGNIALHTGIDLRGNIGDTVMAALDGVVEVVDENWLYGKRIIISHSNGYKTLYAHLNSFSVKKGDRVIQGRKIGELGNTGYSTGPHLHFSIYDKNNKLVNPLELLR